MIQIKNPCDANWQEMTSAESGKYCRACEKVVVDFSNMNDVEIKNYFLTYKEQKTCGRFLTSQINRELKTPSKNYLTVLSGKISRARIIQSVIFLLASSFIWLSSCVKKQNPAMLGEPQYDGPDKHRLMGDTVLFEDIDTSAFHQQDTIPHITGEITNYEGVRMGKVRMVDTINQRIKRRRK